jgi:hypothetical protein
MKCSIFLFFFSNATQVFISSRIDPPLTSLVTIYNLTLQHCCENVMSLTLLYLFFFFGTPAEVLKGINTQ